MKLTVCRVPVGNVPPVVSNVERTAAVIRIFLSTARLYELAMAGRRGAAASLLRERENSLLFLVHDDFYRLQEFELIYRSHEGCQVCSLKKAVYMLGRSQYSGGCDQLVEDTTPATKDNLVARANMDWEAEFRGYIRDAHLAKTSRGYRRMERAKLVFAILRQIPGNVAASEVLRTFLKA